MSAYAPAYEVMELTISRVVRHGGNTASGNPRYRVYFTNGASAVTKADAAINYSVSNSDLRDKPVKVTFEHGHITHVEDA